MKPTSALKLVCICLLLLLVEACAIGGSFYGVGNRNSRGLPEGAWTLYRHQGNPILGKGSFVNGEPDGAWTLWDAGGFKVAEISFTNGEVNGEYRFYYSSHTPVAQNRLKTIGHQVMGQSLGLFERYLPDGKLLVKYRLMKDNKYEVIFGDWRDVAVQSEADKDLLRIDKDAIRAAIKNSAPQK